ncbi:AraC family transcriptional regulator [Flavobacterium magnum]|uniref:AraC family transcriptional regulator n=1 Tax=Flavobacterium magnum TaxID=2162713 RepID=A0A2S0RET2_9FLAO|nr:AraC family transcriptional regulator [Flavobacterium magnum]AWA30186.1 AraC family transcriptional regulator [Flavobacterium magnum]
MNEIAILNINQFRKPEAGEDFYANTLANHLVTSHKHIERPHKHDFYAAILFTKGTGRHHIDFRTFNVKPGSLFLMSPGQAHSWSLSAEADGFIFFHTKAFYDLHFINGIDSFTFFSPLRNTCELVLDGVALQETEQRFVKILAESGGAALKRDELILSLLSQIYIGFGRAAADQNPINAAQHSYSVRFHEFEKYVEQHFRTEKSAEAYAGMMHMTAKHLNRINKAVIGKTTTDIITERVLLEAKRMLIHSRKNLSEIAYELGFEDYGYFSKLFKRRVGVGVREFQSQSQ